MAVDADAAMSVTAPVSSAWKLICIISGSPVLINLTPVKADDDDDDDEAAGADDDEEDDWRTGGREGNADVDDDDDIGGGCLSLK